MALTPQTYGNHTRIFPLYHYVASPLILVTFIGSLVNLFRSLDDSSRLYNAALIVALTLATMMLLFFARSFALRAQDRAIRAEEQLRHYALTGKVLDPRLSIRQIVGLRFASNDEFPTLAQRAAEQGLSQRDIKRAVTNWRADTDRV